MSPLIKICGITRHDQALQAAELGASFIGINFWPQSKRYLPVEKAAWLSEMPASTSTVGVFVNPDYAYLEKVISSGLVSIYQLHGDESPCFCAVLLKRGLKIIKAFQVRDETSLERIAEYPVNDILLDAYHPDERGGLGETFPWELALAFKRKYPDRALYLAGGLTPENIGDAVRGVRPFAVDVASGVENGIPGVKDMEKVVQFIQRAKGKS